jgi:hypothetical protein
MKEGKLCRARNPPASYLIDVSMMEDLGGHSLPARPQGAIDQDLPVPVEYGSLNLLKESIV